MPSLSHILGIKVYSLDSNLLEGASITVTLGSESITGTTDSNGECILNMSSFSSWSVGDTISITAYKINEGIKTSTLVLDNTGGQTIELTLAETSDLSYYEYSDTDKYPLVFSLITTYDGEKVTRSNPLPVIVSGQSDYVDLINNPSTVWSITRDDGQPDYEEVTIAGVAYRRTFTYNSNNILIARSEWVKQ